MAPHSGTLAWKILWMEEPGRLRSMGSLGVRHDITSLSLITFMHWRRKWQPTPGLLPGESQGWRSLVGCCLWGRTESDTTSDLAVAIDHTLIPIASSGFYDNNFYSCISNFLLSVILDPLFLTTTYLFNLKKAHP